MPNMSSNGPSQVFVTYIIVCTWFDTSNNKKNRSLVVCRRRTNRQQSADVPAHSQNNAAGAPEIRSILNSSVVIENHVISGEIITDAKRIRVVYAQNKIYRLLAISLGETKLVTIKYVVVTRHKLLNTIHFESDESRERKLILIISVNSTKAF